MKQQLSPATAVVVLLVVIIVVGVVGYFMFLKKNATTSGPEEMEGEMDAMLQQEAAIMAKGGGPGAPGSTDAGDENMQPMEGEGPQ